MLSDPSALCSSCSDITPMSPRMPASMPCTAADAPCTVVTQGMFIDTAAERISYPSMRGPELPYGVLITMSTSPARIASTADCAGRDSLGSSKCLRTSSHGNPVAPQHLRRARGGQDAEPEIGEAFDGEDQRALVAVGDRDEHRALGGQRTVGGGLALGERGAEVAVDAHHLAGGLHLGAEQ